eukprot:TRINITY_DN11251_c0_g1_i1.p1 TRINITY_DN11251_c0_g1~~TRINITY_DN11251_c0_g1_i1.p1  ORF type:complete len:1286 (+),score=268.20 TRINITY_DN11251_c0_g1_i1:59-3916(+)
MTSSFGATNVVVAVRARPLTPQEEAKGDNNRLTLAMDQGTKTTTLMDLNTGAKKKFRFDYNYWSVGDMDTNGHASQLTIFNDLAEAQLKHALSGYNACIFAYGQTSSGKTHTMMGPPSHTDHSKFSSNTGLIPRMCDSLFTRIEQSDSAHTSIRVEMSFYEIYNEKVYCLLDPSTNGSLKPREDPKAGPYVENLQAVQVTHYQHVAELLKIGNKTRHTSKTKMNDRSSRSHAVFCLTITKSEWNKDSGDATEFISRVNLVDLAGSERTSKAGTEGDTLKEGININKSLTSLGMVIKKLADLNDPSVQADGSFVPYRDSTLTWLLKDNLGGNSRTVMLATLSPCKYNYDETHTTLRYAERVKLIKNAPSVNRRGSSRKIIRDLRQQIRSLHEQLATPQLALSTSYRSTPIGIWATSPFLQRKPILNEPFIWLLSEGYTVVTSTPSYEYLRTQDALPSASMGSMTPRTKSRRNSAGTVKRTPSYLQPTLASAFKDTEVAEQLKGSDMIGKDLAHTVMTSTDENKPRRLRSVDMGGRKSSRKRSSSGGVGKRSSVAKDKKQGSGNNIEPPTVEIKQVEDSEGEDEPEAQTAVPTLNIPMVKCRTSSILGVRLSSSSLQIPPSVNPTPRDDASLDSDIETFFENQPAPWSWSYANKDVHSIKIAGITDPDNAPYAVFKSTGSSVSLLPLGSVYLNGNLLPCNATTVLSGSCEIRFGSTPPFIFMDPKEARTVNEKGEVNGADVLEEASKELLDGRLWNDGVGVLNVHSPTPAEAMLQKRVRELEEQNTLLMADRSHQQRHREEEDERAPKSVPSPTPPSLDSITLTQNADSSWTLVPGTSSALPPLTAESAGKLLEQIQNSSSSFKSGSGGAGLKVITTSDYNQLKHDVIVEKAKLESAKSDLEINHQKELLSVEKDLEITRQRLAVLEFQNVKAREQADSATASETEVSDLRVRAEDLNRLLAEGDLRRRDLELTVRKMESNKREEIRELESKLGSEDYKAQQKKIESEVHDKYRQLDILKAQIGDKKHATKQLQDSYNERLTDLEREAWEKHRAIKELQIEEQDGVSRLQQLKQEEERLAEKLAKHKKAKEEVMCAKELNAVDEYEFMGGLRLDDPMFRNKGIMLSRQSRTPICLKFTLSGLVVHNADALKTGVVRQTRGPSRALSPAGRAIGGAAGNPSSLEPLREVLYDKIQKVKLIDGCVIQVTASGHTSDLGILCDNKQKRTAIQKLLMLKTKGVILALPNHPPHIDPHDCFSEEEITPHGNSPSNSLSPTGIPPMVKTAVRR